MQPAFRTAIQRDLSAGPSVRAHPAKYAVFRRFPRGTARAAYIALFLGWAGFAAAAPPASRPDFVVITQVVVDYFKSLEGHQAGDLVSRSQIAQALQKVGDAGWDVPGTSEVVKRGLSDDSFLVRELSTPAGRRFMRKISRHPGGYDRLHRLSSIQRGDTLVRDLIYQPGGDTFIEYLATTKSGRNLGQMLAGAQQGVDLNKPTGRIYTVEDLLAVLKRVYATTDVNRASSRI